MMKEKLNADCNHFDQLWTHDMAMTELHKVTPIPKRDVRSWLAKYLLDQVVEKQRNRVLYY